MDIKKELVAVNKNLNLISAKMIVNDIPSPVAVEKEK
jgi:hypothetical protein